MSPSPRILFMSGSAGLGHATRDLAIAREIRALLPRAEISWLAASPAKEFLAQSGEQLLPEAEGWADITAEAEGLSGSGGLNITMWAIKIRPLWAANARVYFRLMAQSRFDIAIGDETYELMIALLDRKAPRYPLAVLWDFVGLGRTSWNPVEALGVFLFNKNWRKATSELGITPVLLGELEDVPSERFGPFLADRRAWTAEHVTVAGYVLQFDPASLRDTALIKSQLGYSAGPLVVCTIGGTAIGRELLELCGKAFPYLEEARPGLQMAAFCGPRIPPASVDLPQAVRVHGFVPDLYLHLAASDVTVTQAGGTTTLELTALRRPFVYFPLKGHYEQEQIVSNRLRRHRAGVEMRLARTSPAQLAARILELMQKPVDYARAPVDGARKTAQVVAGLADRARPRG
jgi:UDP:flavonoid glycosyltransferase YjiC (YdhE family)